jgi:hypothetical protein
VKITVFLDMMLCSLEDIHPHFGGTYCFHPQVKIWMFSQNVANDYLASENNRSEAETVLYNILANWYMKTFFQTFSFTSNICTLAGGYLNWYRDTADHWSPSTVKVNSSGAIPPLGELFNNTFSIKTTQCQMVGWLMTRNQMQPIMAFI